VRIVFLASTKRDLVWFGEYYQRSFAEGRVKAVAHYLQTKAVLKGNPNIGHPSEEDGLREFPISRTPFVFIYRVRGSDIEIVRLWDNRAKRPVKWT
jgi:plasmid stabilization system protein ParE